jgi:polyisoprenoid-binding protein YceI
MADDNRAFTSAGDLRTLITDATGSWSLDPAGSSVQFHVKHFWGIITVHGRFEKIEGEGRVDPDGRVSGHLTIDARSLTTKNRKRDEHLRSADFFDVEQHPTVNVTAESLASDGNRLSSRVTLEAAGRQTEIEPAVEVVSATSDAVVLHSSVMVDRTIFEMTWSPLGMASRQARGEVTARFVRASG